jgi:hypothetical protein
LWRRSDYPYKFVVALKTEILNPAPEGAMGRGVYGIAEAMP